MKTPNKLSLIFYDYRNNSLGTCSILFQASILLYLSSAGRVPKKESGRFMEVHSKPWLFPPAARYVTSWLQQVGITALHCLAHETGERITGHTGWAGLFPTQLSGTLSQVPQPALPLSDIFKCNCRRGKSFQSASVRRLMML